MNRGSIWNLAAAVVLLGIVLFRYAAALMAGHMPAMELKNLALDASLIVFAINRILRWLQPTLAIIRPMRFFAIALFVAYLGLKVQH